MCGGRDIDRGFHGVEAAAAGGGYISQQGIMGVEAAAVDEWDVFQYIVGVGTVVVGVWGWRMGRGGK